MTDLPDLLPCATCQRQQLVWIDPRLELPNGDCDIYIACYGHSNSTPAIERGNYTANDKTFHGDGSTFSAENDFWHMCRVFGGVERKEDKMLFWCHREKLPPVQWEPRCKMCKHFGWGYTQDGKKKIGHYKCDLHGHWLEENTQPAHRDCKNYEVKNG